MNPTDKDIVTLLCTFIIEEEKEVSYNSSSRKQKYLVFEFPKKDQCIKKNEEISFQKGKGWTNPCIHLKTCLCHGKMSELYDIYKENMGRKQHELSDFFTPIVMVSTTEEAMYDWIEYSLFLSYLFKPNQEYRR